MQPGCLETADILKYCKQVEKWGTVAYHLRKTFWENTVESSLGKKIALKEQKTSCIIGCYKWNQTLTASIDCVKWDVLCSLMSICYFFKVFILSKTELLYHSELSGRVPHKLSTGSWTVHRCLADPGCPPQMSCWPLADPKKWVSLLSFQFSLSSPLLGIVVCVVPTSDWFVPSLLRFPSGI